MVLEQMLHSGDEWNGGCTHRVADGVSGGDRSSDASAPAGRAAPISTGNRIGGRQLAVSGATFTSVNPARPSEVVAVLPDSPASDVDDAVAAAADAQRAWAEVPIPARAELIAAAADVLAARKAELAHLVSREAGKVLVEAGGDVQEAVDMGRLRRRPGPRPRSARRCRPSSPTSWPGPPATPSASSG